MQRKEVNYLSSRSPLIPSAKSALTQFKTEVASELGLSDYDDIDKGNLTSRANGYVGGNMTKKMVAFTEQQMSSNS